MVERRARKGRDLVKGQRQLRLAAGLQIAPERVILTHLRADGRLWPCL